MQPTSAKPWVAFYPKGTRPTIDSLPFHTIADLATELAKTYTAQTAFTAVMPNGMNGSLSFQQVDEYSDYFAVYLREVLGLRQGDRVAVQIPNSLPYPIIAFGVFKAGCVLVNTNPLYTGDEMGHQFADAKPQALVIVDMFADKLPAALKHYHIPHVILTKVSELLPPIPRNVIWLVQKFLKFQIPSCAVPHIRFAKTLALGASWKKRKSVAVANYTSTMSGEDLACLQYTGGTTGVAKGAMLSHKNLIMNMAQTIEMVGPDIEKGKETVMTALPLYHIFAFTVNFLGFYWLGARNLLIPSPRPLTNLKKPFENFAVTWVTGVNTLYNGLNNADWFIANPPKSMKKAIAGGMALQGSVAKRWTEITGTPLIEGYGLTETSPVVTFNPFGKEKPNSIGIPIPSTDVRCLDDLGEDVQQGQPGELAVRGPQVMMGYWQRPQETAKIMKDGWLLTGDVAVVDQDGYVFIVDRKKDMILVSGFNVYPNEVEDVLSKHPGILESAVIGVPDGAAGEAVKAFVVKRDPTLTAEDVRSFCKEHLTGYKIPKLVEFRADLPKTPVGKILRKNLRAETQVPQQAS